jgi:DNA-binding NarL/FixJ family response regulator
MIKHQQYTEVAEYLQAGFTVTEISQQLKIPRSKVVTYLSKYLSQKNQPND